MDIENLGNREFNDKVTNLIEEFVKTQYNSEKEIEQVMVKLKRKYNFVPTKRVLREEYEKYIKNNKSYEKNDVITQYFKVKKVRGLSGVTVVSTITSPYPTYIDDNGKEKTQRFSCKHDCFYCPRELDENGKEKNARSYLSDEPTVARGLDNDYDAYKQFMARGRQYVRNGHIFDKIELIVLGGTWTEYPRDYQKTYIRDLFYAANTFYDKEPKRHKLSIENEHEINERAKVKIIGLTLEMRPDSINEEEIHWLRNLGCTRIQLGVQHTNDKILKKVNRGCYLKDTIYALNLLKDFGYKVDAHWMPDLPDSSYEIDKEMFDFIIENPLLQFDQWKIYPTAVVPWTKIKEWYENGSYKSWVEADPEKFMQLIMYVKQKIPKWIRINRLVRDIPNTDRDGNLYIYGGNKTTNLRQVIDNRLHKEAKFCNCIRCREIKNNKQFYNTQTIVRKYSTDDADEYFISIESSRSKNSIYKNDDWYNNGEKENGLIHGFVRLRLPYDNINTKKYFPILYKSALIRELHVYGDTIAVNSDENNKNQHTGYGKKLLNKAEHLARFNNYWKISVISGIGVKGYYKKNGYYPKETYMVKNIIPYYVIYLITVISNIMFFSNILIPFIIIYYS